MTTVSIAVLMTAFLFWIMLQLSTPINDNGSTAHKLVRPHFKHTKEKFENHVKRLGRYIFFAIILFYFIPCISNLTGRFNNLLMINVILFTYI